MEQLKKRDTKSVGDLSEIVVLHALIRLGYPVSVPWGENHRYDLIVEIDETLKKVQVKTGRLRMGSILFNAYSSHAHRKQPARSYRGDADYFGVYCPEVRHVFLVPVGDVTERVGCLRWERAKNGQNRKIRWADPYVLPVEPVQLVVGLEVLERVSFANVGAPPS
jgi:PD-(D/E)XK endonuclease